MKRAIILLLCLSCSIRLSAQNGTAKAAFYPAQGIGSKATEILQGFENRFKVLDSLIFHINIITDTTTDPTSVTTGINTTDSTTDTTAIATTTPDTSLYEYNLDSNLYEPILTTDSLTPLDSAYMEQVRLQQRAFKHKTGLQLSGQVYYRFDHSLGFDEDDAISRYDGKIQAELRWYFLQSSLFKRKGNLEEIRLKGEIARVAKNNERVTVSAYQQREYARLMHDSLLAGILLHRIENLNLLHQANQYLLNNEDISSDELLKIIDEKATAERALSAISGDFPVAGQLSGIEAFSVHVDTAALIEHISQTNNEMHLFDLRIQLLQQQERNTSYWSHFNLAPFVRYSYYIRPQDSPRNSSNVDAGISFTIPISGESCIRKKAIHAEQDVLIEEMNHIYGRVVDRVYYAYGEIERLNRAMAGEFERANELKRYIAARTEAYRGRIGEYNMKARLREYNIFLMCLENLVELGYRRDSRLLDLQEILADQPILQYCTISPFGNNATEQQR